MCHQCRYVSRASLCLHLTFIWRRRCMLWNDFCADNKLNGNKESGCFCSTLWITLCNNDVLTALERAHDLPLRMFLSLNHHDRDNNEETTNTCTTSWAKPPVRNLLVDHVFNCCVGGTIARTCKLVSSLHVRKCMLSISSGDCFVVEPLCWSY